MSANEPQHDGGYDSLYGIGRRFDRFEIKVEERMTRLEERMTRLEIQLSQLEAAEKAALQARTGAPLNWTFIVASLVLAIAIGAIFWAMAVLK